VLCRIVQPTAHKGGSCELCNARRSACVSACRRAGRQTARAWVQPGVIGRYCRDQPAHSRGLGDRRQLHARNARSSCAGTGRSFGHKSRRHSRFEPAADTGRHVRTEPTREIRNAPRPRAAYFTGLLGDHKATLRVVRAAPVPLVVKFEKRYF